MLSMDILIDYLVKNHGLSQYNAVKVADLLILNYDTIILGR